MKAASFVCLTFALLACSDSTSPVPTAVEGLSIAPSKSTYQVGDKISAVLVNESARIIEYGACAIDVERKNGSRWSRVWPTSGACEAILFFLPPNSSRTTPLAITNGLSGGTYRLRILTMAAPGSSPLEVYSSTFTVQ